MIVTIHPQAEAEFIDGAAYYAREADTALGEVAPTRCGHAFFGTSSCLFATDAPFDCEQGRALIRDTIKAVEALPITPGRREMIFAGNARSLLKLPGITTAEARSRA